LASSVSLAQSARKDMLTSLEKLVDSDSNLPISPLLNAPIRSLIHWCSVPSNDLRIGCCSYRRSRARQGDASRTSSPKL